MELPWSTKLKIAATIAFGAVAIGIVAWPLVAPADPIMPVRASSLTAAGTSTLLALAFIVGFACYFFSWPYGREIAVLAVPSGLAVWAIRAGDVAVLIQQSPTLSQRQAIMAGLRWEPLFWLLVVAAGFAGVFTANRLKPAGVAVHRRLQCNPRFNRYVAALLAIAISAVIAQLSLRILARELPTTDNHSAAQVLTGQVVFAVFASFGLAAFVTGRFLKTSYVWCVLSTAIVIALSTTTYLNQKVLTHFLSSLPANFFPDSVASISPVQMVAFGTLGALWGHYLAFKYEYWRRHESGQ